MPTLDETLAETLSEIQEKNDDEVVEPETETEEKPEDRARDEKGRFAEKEETPDTETKSDETDETITAKAEPEREGVEAPEAAIAENLLGADGTELNAHEQANAPTTWRAASKAKWADVDPLIKEEVHKRERESREGVALLKDDATFGRQLNSVVEPYMPTIRARGITPEVAIETMLNAYHILETAQPQQKAQQLLATAQQYGVINEVMSLLTNQQGQPVQPVGLTPQDVDRMVDEKIAARDQQVSKQTTENEIEQFETAVNDDGILVYPYFENVRRQMGAIVEAEGVTLEEAYERAIWAMPDIRNLLISQQTASEEEKKKAEAKEHVGKAKKAAGNNIAKKPAHSTEQPSPTGSVDDTLSETLRNIKARA